MVKGKATKKPAQKPQKVVRPTVPAAGNQNETSIAEDRLPLSLQQNLLNIFRDACVNKANSDFESALQEVKGHLYNRDFAAAFGKEEYLQAYAARWSPSRAIGYAQIFHDLGEHLLSLRGVDPQVASVKSLEVAEGVSKQNGALGHENTIDVANLEDGVEHKLVLSTGDDDDSRGDNQSNSDKGGSIVKTPETEISAKPGCAFVPMNKANLIKVACIGGGAGAEIIGLAGWLKAVQHSEGNPLGLDVLCLDIAHWDTVAHELHEHAVTAPKLSKYASEAARAANAALLSPECFQVRFRQQDVLALTPAEIDTLVSQIEVVTIMFTLNELYTTSVPKAQRLLYNLTTSLKPGALLLVVDSPGSYSSVTINGAEKKYPMQWLLDHTLLEATRSKSPKSEERMWEKIVSDESRWFRVPEALKYPIELENMRYQIHLYRRIGQQI